MALFLVRFDGDETFFLADAEDEAGARAAMVARCQETGAMPTMQEVADDYGEPLEELLLVTPLPSVEPGRAAEVGDLSV